MGIREKMLRKFSEKQLLASQTFNFNRLLRHYVVFIYIITKIINKRLGL